MHISTFNKAVSDARNLCIKARGTSFAASNAHRMLLECTRGVYEDIVRLSDPADLPVWEAYRDILSEDVLKNMPALRDFFRDRVTDTDFDVLSGSFFEDKEGNDIGEENPHILHFDVKTIDADFGSGPIFVAGVQRLSNVGWAYNLETIN